MDAERLTINPETGHKLAALIRDNIEELIDENNARYKVDYTHSINIKLNDQTKRAWARQELLCFADQLETGEVDPHQYELMRGDIVLQNEELLYPIDAFLEMTFYMARMIADLVWEKNVTDARNLNALLTTLETFVQLRTTASLAAFSEQICTPRALLRTWQLGRRWLSRSSSTEAASSQGADSFPIPQLQAGGAPATANSHVQEPRDILAQLTEREAQMAQLVAQGKSNNEVASALGLQLSTVRNAMSRIYVKLGIASRAELIVALSGGQS